jgi:F-type H+-transporting ATPase subunit delta
MAETTTIARPYAQAVFELAREQQRLAEWSGMLGFAASVAANEEMQRLLENPRLTRDEVIGLFLAVCEGQLDDNGKNLIRLLAENGRLPVLPEIAALYEQERARAEGILEAEVISAQELSGPQKAELSQALAKRLGREISLKCTLDASLLGGAVIRAGDMVIDGSAVGRLEKMHIELLR